MEHKGFERIAIKYQALSMAAKGTKIVGFLQTFLVPNENI